MKIDINIGQDGKQEYDDTPEHAGYPPAEKVLGAPATLEISFYNLFTEPDGNGGWKDLEAGETTEISPVEKTVTLDKGFYASRQQTDHFMYCRNSLMPEDQFYIDQFGANNPDRFEREPLEPILVNDPDTDPPNIKDRDIGMRWDGIGVKTPMFHVDLIKDKIRPVSKACYKQNILERQCNNDLKKGIDDYKYIGYDLPRKYRQIKIKKKIPLTYVIDSIWINEAHLSIEEIESASHCVTSMVATTGPTADPPYSPNSAGYAIDSVEGIFYHKFDTYLCKERTGKDLSTIPARYKITRNPSYTDDPITKPILQFIAGGTIKVEAYMVPKDWWYYARFYSPGVYEEIEENLLHRVYVWRVPPEPYTYTFKYVARISRDPIENYTSIFSLWSKPPHDYRLPVRNDNVVDIWNGTKSPTDFDKALVSWMGGFSNFAHPEVGDPYPMYYGINMSNGNVVNTVDAQTWNCFIRPLNDPGFNDVIDVPAAFHTLQAARGNINKGWMQGTTNFVPGTYGFLEGGMRGLFLYNFPFLNWTSADISEYYYGLVKTAGRRPTGTKTTTDVPYVFGAFMLWHKTPTGCVRHMPTRPWINTKIGIASTGGVLYSGALRNMDYQELWGCTLTPPDGGLWKFPDEPTLLTCGLQYPDVSPMTVHNNTDPDYEGDPEYSMWPERERQLYDGGGVYDDAEITNFRKIWNKFLASNLYVNNSSGINAGTHPADNVPFVVGVAGAKAGSLVAMLKVDNKVYYVWRVLDEEDDTGYSNAKPFLPVAAGSSFHWTYLGTHYYNWYPLLGCGEVWNQYTKFGNIKTAWDTIYPGGQNQETPGLYRMATQIVHQGVSWAEDVIPFDEYMASVNTANYVGFFDRTVDELPDPIESDISVYASGIERFNPIIEQEIMWNLEMPAYIMIYREVALFNSGVGASRWGGSFNKLRDNTLFTVSAANRNKDSCG